MHSLSSGQSLILFGVQPFALPLLYLRPNVFVSVERVCRGGAARHQKLVSLSGQDMTARSVAAAVEGLMHLAPACLVAACCWERPFTSAQTWRRAMLSASSHANMLLYLCSSNFGAPDCS